jgi:hypothetical protein
MVGSASLRSVTAIQIEVLGEDRATADLSKVISKRSVGRVGNRAQPCVRTSRYCGSLATSARLDQPRLRGSATIEADAVDVVCGLWRPLVE